ncbi:putative nucleotidyltransferase substrate binding domain-containing protein [Croceicoccus pelagius]|uniref:Cyclic nucleotide-binding protein n=1 Tax=Croceicoccus pelagius TaxID=1703341 RepID=A0A917DJL7_9SPHN|nr:putative nucleotidyltransferase substrate binding domain-containing protein [Croceicoccus pelagius]GGD41569.1 cyclic nucleotide-binding protein [Croceicoccus pelagius]
MQDAPETLEIAEFLRQHPPFGGLSDAELAALIRALEVRYYRRGSTIISAGDENDWFSMVRSGAVELRLGGSDLNARLGEGGCFGYPSLLRDGRAQNEAVALEDSLVYRIAKPAFLATIRSHPEFRAFFEIDEAVRLRRAVDRMRQVASASEGSADTLGAHASIGSLVRRTGIVTGDPGMAVYEAARLMTREDVSTLPICRDGRLIGIVTDKDLRRRVLGVGLNLSSPVSAIMTKEPVTAVPDTPILTALITMAERHIHHLPILDPAGEVIAIVSSNDILSQLGSNALHIAKAISASADSGQVADATSQLPQALTGLVAAGVDADHVSRYVSTIGEGAHRHLLKLGEEKLGPPPVPYALACFGSLARAEQALGSDQDNGFVFGEGYDTAQHDAYFAELARHLCDGLNAAGYRYCPGNIMATNPTYRRTAEEWADIFRSWIESPDPQAVLESTIFFDMRALAGEKSLVEGLRREVFAEAAKNGIFLSFIARAAATTRVPLGFFRNFLLQDDADEGRVLDLKTQAIAPIVDIARTHALAKKLVATNTMERLSGAADSESLPRDAARDLAACFEFVRDVRFRHQAEQIVRGEPPSNKLDPASLSRFDREHLRDAFKLIRDQLEKLRSQFAGGVT